VLSSQEILTAASNLVGVYNDDPDVSEMNLCTLLNSLMHSRMNKMKVSRESFVYQLILKKASSGSISKCGDSTQHVFGTDQQLQRGAFILKIETDEERLCTSMCNDRLSHLALMSIEAGILREINFVDVVTDIAKKKAQKVFTA